MSEAEELPRGIDGLIAMVKQSVPVALVLTLPDVSRAELAATSFVELETELWRGEDCSIYYARILGKSWVLCWWSDVSPHAMREALAEAAEKNYEILYFRDILIVLP